MKKIKKAFLSLAMVLVLVCGVAFSISAEEENTQVDPEEYPVGEIVEATVFDGNISKTATWHYDKDTKTLTVSGSGNASCKEEDRMFAHYDIETVKVTGTITKLGEYLFACLGDCTTLKTVDITAKVEELDYACFAKNESLTDVSLPDSVTKIKECTFEDCLALNRLNIPKNLKEIYSNALSSYNKKVTLPNSVTYVGYLALGDTNYVPDKNGLAVSGKTLLYADYKKNFGNYTLDKNIVTLAGQCFSGVTAKRITLPKTVKYIDKTSFDFSNINEVKILNPSIKFVGQDDVYWSCKVLGLTNSTAQKFAKKYGLKFTPTDKPKFAALKLKVKAGKKSFTATWKKLKNANGYKLQYSLKKNFKKAKTITIKKAKTIKKTIKKLKKNKKYYVRIRAYKKVRGKTYYSNYSKTKITVK